MDEPGQSTPGYTLICTVEDDQVYLVDPEGKLARQWHVTAGMTNWCYLMPNGHLFMNERCEDRKGVALTVSGQMSEYDTDGKLVWRHVDPYQHHDCRRLDDGAVFAAFLDIDDAEKALIQGGVPGSETPDGPFGEVIREVDESGQVNWEWSFANLGMETHALHRNANRWSYGHTNTICPIESGYLVCSKNLCMAFIVDRTSGQVTWEYQSDELSGPHDAQMLDNGNVLIFANGAYMSDLHRSQVLELDPRSNEVVWRYFAKDDACSFFSPHMSSAQRLPSGNTLICEGSKGCIFEVTPEGDIVREYVNPYFAMSGTFGMTNWMFRTRWYAPDSSEIRSLGL